MRTPAAWFTEVGTVALILIPGMVLFTVVWMIPAVLGMVMVFGGPFYAAYFVPTTIARWRAARDGVGEPDQVDSPSRRSILHFATTNQLMTLILNVLLILNLVGAGIYTLLSPGPPSGAESYISPVIEFGVFATLAAIPLIIGNLRWRLDAEAVPVESIALRHRVGSWKLIKANRFLSLIVWCGYPLASILMLIHPMG